MPRKLRDAWQCSGPPLAGLRDANGNRASSSYPQPPDDPFEPRRPHEGALLMASWCDTQLVATTGRKASC